MGVWGSASPWGITSWSSGGVVASLPQTISTTGAGQLEQLLGVDVLFDGQFRLTAAKDLALVRGIAALNQSLYHRIITSPGEFGARPGYGVGIKRWVKRANKRGDLHELEQVMEDQLSLEHRVSRVKEVYVGDLDSAPGIIVGFDIEAAGVPVSFKPLAFTDQGVRVA